MKKNVCWVAMLLPAFLSSCTQDEQVREVRVQDEVECQFGWHVVSSGSMTRAVTSDEVLDRIASLLPTDTEINRNGIDVTREGQTINIKVGKTQTMKTGDYAVSKDITYTGFRLTNYLLTIHPPFRIQHEWTITNDTHYYMLPATFTCAALAWDNTECTLYIDGQAENGSFPSDDHLSILFVSEIKDGATLQVKLVPSDTEQHAAIQWSVDKEQLELGKYYRLQCPKATESVEHEIQYTEFVEGVPFT